jgi:hypothetical protein
VKAEDLKRSLLYQMLLKIPEKRLKAKSPPGETARKLINSRYNSANFSVPNQNLEPDPNEKVLGINLPRSTWSILNRL